MSGWDDFLLAEASASAALAGLIFVGVSINLGKILALPNLPGRAFEALMVLITVLIISSLLLVPGQPLMLIGAEVLVTGVAIWTTILVLDRNIWRRTLAEHRRHFGLLILLNQLTTLPYIISGIMILLSGADGIYWLVPASLLSFVKALLDAWVLLVEINR